MYDGKDELLVMHEDLERALKKSKPDWVMLIDTRRCILCHACTIGCMAEYKSPPGMQYRPMYEMEKGTYPRVDRQFVARPCQQCDNPPCVSVCPNIGKATWKGDSGVSNNIVMMNYEQCIGCGRCVAACPYGARNLDNGTFYTDETPSIPDMERGPAWEYDKKWTRQGKNLPAGTARKCQFCYLRLKSGMLPVCVTTCIGRATYFGDMTDTDSLISKVMKTSKVVRLKEVKEAGEIAAKIDAKGPKMSNREWIALTQDAIKAYPGKRPVFGNANTKPRVFYII
jgi:molybdopterin-containing oxidoreductase family iron-sulfur binding subunit